MVSPTRNPWRVGQGFRYEDASTHRVFVNPGGGAFEKPDLVIFAVYVQIRAHEHNAAIPEGLVESGCIPPPH